MVIQYIRVLLSTNACKKKILDSDIGIVTPYKKQATKILEKCDWTFLANNLTIGTAAVLQGQEKPIIIISTVSVGQLSNFACDFRVIHQYFYHKNLFFCLFLLHRFYFNIL